MSTGQEEHTGAGQYYRRLLALAFVHWKIFAVSIVGMILVAATDTSLAAYMKPLMDDGFVNRDHFDASKFRRGMGTAYGSSVSWQQGNPSFCSV